MVNCDWCGDTLDLIDARLVTHRGKKEAWCHECVNEDAWGNVSSLRSVLGRKRKKDRPKTMED